MKFYIKVIFIFTLLVNTTLTFAANISSFVSGNWNAGGIWVGGVAPVAGDNVTVEIGHIITVTAPAACTDLTVNGTLTNTTFTLAVSGNIINAGTFTSGSGVHTLSGSGKTITGILTITSISITGSYSNTGTLTVTTLAGAAGTLTNAANATLNISGSPTILNLVATANPNTVNYTAAAQTIKGTVYHHLNFSGSGNKTLNAISTIGGNLSISGTATLIDAGFQITGNISGTFTMANGTFLTLGSVATATTFPTNFITGNITLTNTSTVTYNSSVAQIISGTPAYSNLTLTTTLTVVKTANAPVIINKTLTINANNTLADGGNIITCKGNITNNGIHSGLGKIYLNGGTILHTLAGTGTYGIFELNDTFGSSLTGSPTINGNITITAGQFALATRTLTTSGDISIASGATLYLNGNAKLKVANGKTITNSGTFYAVGTLGNVATVTNTGSGNFNINQSVGTATFRANYYVFDYCNVIISNGTVHATDNLSNGSFSNGTGNEYLNLDGFANAITPSFITFNSGPTYNIRKTSGAGVITITGASGTLSGETFDQDNADPGTLINWTNGTIYYSQGSNTFSTLANWNTIAGGGGTSPIAANLTSGLCSFIIQDGHTVTVNQAITIFDLTVGTGTSGILTIGNSITSRTVTIRNNTTVANGGTINVGAFASTHLIYFYGNLSVNGTFDTYRVAGQVANVYFYKSGTTAINGTPVLTQFNTITLGGATTATPIYILDIEGNFVLGANTTFNSGNYTHTIAGNWTGNATGTHTSTGTIKFDGAAQTIAGATSFYNLELAGTGTKTLSTGVITVNNNFNITSNSLTIAPSIAVNVTGNLTVSATPTIWGGATANTTTVTGNLLVTNNSIFTIGSAAIVKTLNIIGDVQVDLGSTINIGAFATTHLMNITGNLINNGTFNMVTATTQICNVTFNGNVNKSISGTGATCNFNGITINKGTGNSIVLEVTRVITMSPRTVAGSFITLTNGTFKLSSASTLTPFYGAATICSANGCLWINNSGANVSCVGTAVATTPGIPTITGKLQVSAGVFGYGSGNDIMTLNSATSNLTIDGGTVNIYGGIAFTSSSQLNFTSGSLNIDPQAADNLAATSYIANFASTNATNAVTFTNGILTIIDPHSTTGTGLAFYVTPTAGYAYNFNGGTIQFGDGISSTIGSVDGFDASTGALYFNGNILINNTATNAATRFVRITAASTFTGNLTINSAGGSNFNTNGFTLSLKGNLSNNGIFTSTTVGSMLTLNGTAQQTISGSGIFTTGTSGRILGLTINNSSGANPAIDLQCPLALQTALTLTSGSLNTSGAGAITLGIGAASTLTITRTNGSLSASPTWNLTGVTACNLTYNAAAGQISTGNEIPLTANGNISTLTINNATGVLLNSANITIATSMTLTSGVFNIQNNLLNINGSITRTSGTLTVGTGASINFGTNAGLLTIPASTFTVNPTEFTNLTINRAGGVSLSANQNITLNGILTLTTGTFRIVTNTLTFQTHNTPIIKTGGTLTTAAGSSLAFGSVGNTGGAVFQIPTGTFTAVPSITNFSVNRDNKLTLGNQALTLSGTLTLTKGEFDNNGLAFTTTGTIPFAKTTGTFTIGAAGSLVFNANVTAVTLPDNLFTSAPASFANLVMNRGSGVLVSLGNQEISITGTITLTAVTGGILEIKNADLQISTLAGTSSATSMIITNGTGYLKRNFATGASAAFIFPVGDNSVPDAAQYSPVSITFSANSVAGNVGVKCFDIKHAGIAQSDTFISRYWDFSAPALTNYTYTATFSYTVADVVGSSEAIFYAQRYDNGSALWTMDAASTTNAVAHSFTTGSLTQTTGKLDNNSFTSSSYVSGIYFWSKASGNWNGGSTIWETSATGFDPGVGNGTPSAATPSYSNNSGITIRNGNNITVNAGTYSADELIIISGGTLTLGANDFTIYNGTGTDFTLNGVLTTTSGRILFNSTGASMDINGTLTTADLDGFNIDANSTISTSNTPTITLGTNSIVDFAGAATQKIDSRTDYANLNISSAGQKDVQGAITINKNLTITTATFADGGYTITSKGNITNNGSYTGTGKLYLNGGSASHDLFGSSYIIGEVELNDIQGATWTSTGSASITGLFTVTSGTFTLNAFTGGFSVSGLTAVTGTLAIGNATGTKSFSNLTINANASFTNTGNSNVSLSGSLISNGSSFTSGSGTYTFSGTAKTFTGTCGFTGMNGVITGTYTYDCDTSIISSFGDLNISGGAAQLTIAKKTALTVGTSLTNSGTILVDAGANGKSGSFITPASITNTGTCSFKTSIAKAKWHCISSPISNAVIETVFSDLANNNNNFFYYNEAATDQNFWVRQTSGAMTPGKGYYLYYLGNKIKTYTAVGSTFNAGTYIIPVTYTNPGRLGYNFIGNPYPSSIDWDDVTNIILNNVGNEIQVRNGEGWESYVRGGGGVNRYVYPGQGFFVTASANGNVTINNGARVHYTSGYLKSNKLSSSYPKISLELSCLEMANNTYFRFIDEASTEYDSQYDAHKLFSENNEWPEIYSVAKLGDTLSINSTPFNSIDTIIPIGIKIGKHGEYKIKVKELTNFNTDVYLVDAITNIWTNLRNEKSYSFISESYKGENRFSLRFNKFATEIAEQHKTDIGLAVSNPYYCDKKLNFVTYNFQKNDLRIDLLDLTGKIIYNQKIKMSNSSQLISIDSEKLTSGCYMLRVSNSKEIVTKKVCIIE